MITALLTAAAVPAGGLDVAVRVRADPYRGPGGRDRQPANALQRIEITDQCAVWKAVVEPVSCLVPAYPRHIVISPRSCHSASRMRRVRERRRSPTLFLPRRRPLLSIRSSRPGNPNRGQAEDRKPGSSARAISPFDSNARRHINDNDLRTGGAVLDGDIDRL